ncbi:hypothetical protein GCM10009868_35740 [Terrabacter aerolatus]|uniref:Uncharacterized protein n=1 Tax=Terrabacter aerolatus TaxID=422442 RepID=A0A512CW48_9MICO|nr:hypothetical protein [Terrabacter aerolatus]GEO28442.1 hypothetical protein TAE01_02520 [Terrabacter aerolatus]
MVDTSGPATPPGVPSAGEAPREPRPLTRAWISVALVPVFFLVAFAAAQGIYALTGYDPSAGATPPLWADLVAGVPALLILFLPCAGAVVYGRRAVREGARSGFVPMVLGAIVAVGGIVLVALQ